MTSVGNNTGAAIVAHRGWHADGATENSIASLDAAAEHGADSVEFDIRRLGDGTLVVHHDASIGRRSLASMRASDLDRSPDVPTLEEFARRAGELGIGVIAEFKETGYEREALTTLQRYVAPDDLTTMSFEADAVRALHALDPQLPVGLLTEQDSLLDVVRRVFHPDYLASEAAELGASFIAMELPQATGPVLDAARARGLGTAVWTVDGRRDLQRLLDDPRVDQVITDRPATAQSLREAGGAVREGDVATRSERISPAR